MLLTSALLMASLTSPQDGAGSNASAASTAFACDLYSRLAAEEGNLFLSPYSISAALAMTLEGAAGQTAAQMEEVLRLSQEDAAAVFAELDRRLTPPRAGTEAAAFRLRIANALWVREGLALRERFAQVLSSAYGAGFAELDFHAGDQARAAINDWVGEQTEQRIRELIPSGYLTPDTGLVLTNAVYFQAAWESAFPRNATAPETFTTGDGRRVRVPMMRSVDIYSYVESEGTQVLELPYRGGALSMLIVLPEARDGLPALEGQLSPHRLAAWSAALEPTQVTLRLPRFRFSGSHDLTALLQAAGMTAAFRFDQADFSGIAPDEEDPLFISAVLHEAFVAVDEDGTEAAAATAVLMKLGCAVTAATATVTADHPFLFLIRHRATGCVLFMGRVDDPSQGAGAGDGAPPGRDD